MAYEATLISTLRAREGVSGEGGGETSSSPPQLRRRCSTLPARVTRLTLHSPSSSPLCLHVPFSYFTLISLPLIFPLPRKIVAWYFLLSSRVFLLFVFLPSPSPFFLSFFFFLCWRKIYFGRVYVKIRENQAKLGDGRGSKTSEICRGIGGPRRGSFERGD